MADDRKMVLVGAITGAHGVRGEVKVKSFTAIPASIAAYGPLYDESGARRFDLNLTVKGTDAADPSGKGVLIGRIAGDHLEPVAGSALALVAELGEAGEGRGE